MIYTDDNTEQFDIELNRLCRADPYGTRIIALRSSYSGKKYNFLDFWIQRDENNGAYAAFCLYSGTMIICGEPYDVTEVREFVQMISPAKIQCRSVAELLPQNIGMQKKSGEIMVFVGTDVYDNGMYKVEQVSSDMSALRKIYDLLVKVFNIKNIDFESFFLSMSHGIRHYTSEIYAILNEYNEPVSTAFVTYKTDYAMIISCVATKKKYRKRGMAEAVLRVILQKYGTGDKKIYLQREDPIKLYDSLGFVKCGEWAEYSKG